MADHASTLRTGDIRLRDVIEADLPVFFEHQRDPDANRMAAFPARSRDAFILHWTKMLGDESVTVKTILCSGQVAGNIVCWKRDRKRLVGFWIGKEYWGKGVAGKALAAFLGVVKDRPLYAHAAKQNTASIRVLEKCGFTICGEETASLGPPSDGVEEVVLVLTAKRPGVATLARMTELSDADREEVRLLTLAVYPPEQFAYWPGRQVEWSTPEWCVRVRSEEGVFLSYVGVYVREAECDGRPVRVGGVGNVKTHPDARGRGCAALGIRQAVAFFREQAGVAFALLVCEPHLLGYYARLGWREFGGRLQVRQHGAPSEFTLNRVMTYGIGSPGPAVGNIDLCGPPW